MIDPAGRKSLPVASVFHRGTALASRCSARAKLISFLLIASFILPQLRADESSDPAPLAAHALLLDAVNTGDKIIAVGDHGIIVISRDNGLTWTQSITPTRALLTAVSFPDPRHGWAVGHDGIILATNDGGQSWQRQDHGKDRESVFLDVRFLDLVHGFAVGAYGKFITTHDGGKNWSATQPSTEETHYNRLSAGADGYLYLAGESGTLLISADSGKTWRKSNVPYNGSLFGSLPLERDSLVIYGLRGHILRSEDHGASWAPLNSETKVLITSGLRLKLGTIVLGGQGGNLFVSHDAGRTFSQWKPADFGTSIAGMVEANDGTIVTVGEAGAVRIKLP